MDALENQSLARETHRACFAPAANIIERNEDFIVEMALPGYDKKDVIIDIEQKLLKVSSKKEFTLEEDSMTLKREFKAGPFERKFELPDTVNPDGIEAQLKSGLLEISIPKMEYAKAKPPREIAIA